MRMNVRPHPPSARANGGRTIGVIMTLFALVGFAGFVAWRTPSSHIPGADSSNSASQPVLILTTPHGLIRIRPRADLAPHSAGWALSVAAQHGNASLGASSAGEFYRTESFLLQGRIDAPSGVPANTEKGPCPPDARLDPNRRCPPHDPKCGCHGPIMSYGQVGWAGGGTGPDFFIYVGRDPAQWWAHDHTVWGEATADSMPVVDAVRALPARDQGGMRMLQDRVRFRLEAGSQAA
eukprot:TRINITY_DN11614_c0_g1_i1.p1 TRINITY_DN11614_c0_g1~~TRINITY_DN11614_c0_g1_i1.p1  ORF type:complete len:236 (+),score=16.75 TRINITY_DN11614_c0_g1_i1:124-831(+)